MAYRELARSRQPRPATRYNAAHMIDGIIIREELQLACVLLVLAFTLGTLYLVQKYTGV
ncbi:MAG TPA: hypothetical protein VNM48_05550 [Chloroflexota bacterium]|nr:hypothetical protein [Chloroflexota bacterium]